MYQLSLQLNVPMCLYTVYVHCPHVVLIHVSNAQQDAHVHTCTIELWCVCGMCVCAMHVSVHVGVGVRVGVLVCVHVRVHQKYVRIHNCS